jgi:hypothetical protein
MVKCSNFRGEVIKIAKRTIENCRLVKKAIRQGVGEPKMIDGKCEGYAGNTDEPCETCKNCNINSFYEK